MQFQNTFNIMQRHLNKRGMTTFGLFNWSIFSRDSTRLGQVSTGPGLRRSSNDQGLLVWDFLQTRCHSCHQCQSNEELWK